MKKQTTIETETLKQHRLAMGYSQQEVAVLVGIQIRQYQRLEYGERSMSATSMRLGLSVCAVLKIDPFQLIFGNGEYEFSDMR